MTIALVDISAFTKYTAVTKTSADDVKMIFSGLFRLNDQLSSAPAAKHVIEEHCQL